jgi:prolyl-tRNA synthetase
MRKKLFQICEEKWRNMGVEDVEMPTLVPIDLLQKMEEHSLGVENHCYQIKQSGLSTITNALILPPSTHPSLQTLLSNIIHEHTLPYGIMTTTKIFRVGESRSLVPLIRSREMWWNEVHMSYVSPKQAESSMNVVWENLNDIFDTFCVTGIRLRRPKWSTYPGAEYTECFDSILPNGRVLQIAAVHVRKNSIC